MSAFRVVKYILRDKPEFGLMPGYCILGLRFPCQHEYLGEPKHTLKTISPYYYEVVNGVKDFELRKDDRTPRFEVGDVIEFIFHGEMAGK